MCGKTIVAVTTPLAGGLVVEPGLADAVRRVVEAAVSPNTRRAYATQFAKFEGWCARRQTPAMPAPPQVVATYLVDLAATDADPARPARGAKVATVQLALSAISAAHRNAGLELDTGVREIRAALKGIRKEYAAPQAQAAALKPAMVRGILATLGDTPLDRRDAALVTLLFAGALRRSEMCGLDWQKPGTGDGYLTLSDEAVEIVLLRSKARTEISTVRVPRPENPGVVAAIERWVGAADIKPGEPIFRSVTKGGHIRGRLTGDGVNVVLKARVARYLQACGYTPEAATEEAAKFSGHSGRTGMYTAASEAGIAIEAVAALARHKSLHVAQRYARNADQLKRAPSKNPALAI
jgi:integrase